MRLTRYAFLLGIAAALPLFSFAIANQAPAPAGSLSNAPQSGIRFAVVGDYGIAGQAELDVANLVKSWNPDLIITTGDNNYPSGAQTTIDTNIGQYYASYIYPYNGTYGTSTAPNRFFPSLGNHDWYTTGATPYLAYFTLPNNERYYDFVRGPVHFFALDSDPNEPDGISGTSAQADWLKSKLAASCARYKVVYLHHAPYSSGPHGSNTMLQWNYAGWGATAVLAGHDHTYERILQNGIPFFVNGLGGAAIYTFGASIPGSVAQYNADWGAMRVDADDSQIVFEFINRAGVVKDTQTLLAMPVTCRSVFLPLVRR